VEACTAGTVRAFRVLTGDAIAFAADAMTNHAAARCEVELNRRSAFQFSMSTTS
jgi:hypothetical protein